MRSDSKAQNRISSTYLLYSSECFILCSRERTSQSRAAAVFLGSDECYMTSQNLQVNGGLTLRRNPLPSEIEESVMAAMAAGQAE